LTNVRLAIVLETATTAGALTGVLLVGIIPTQWLYFLFAAILLVSAQQMWTPRRAVAVLVGAADEKSWGARLALDSSYPDATLGERVEYRVHRVPIGMLLMYAAGLISALLGIGSGVLKIPAMDTALRLPIKVSTATSNFMIGVTAAASAGAYFMRGNIVPGIAGPVALGSVLGSLLGARILLASSSEKIRIFFIVVLLLLAVAMILTACDVHLFGAAK
jgi:hypothetical protein